MSDLEGKLEQHRGESGRARQGYLQHMKRYEAQRVRYVGEEPRPALEVLALSVDRRQGAPIPAVVAVHAMPQVGLWRRVSGGTEAEWWFELFATLEAEWDGEARAWRLLGLNRTESKGWPLFEPRQVQPGQLHQEAAHVEPAVIVTFPAPPRAPPPRRRR